ncbi:Lysophospholipid acyltransferase 1 [Willisornis vidua]|uniref:Lysophospholipid acyltransferase 1 n=1 Tax=Willisornis vidua TaxID=1566151 RepID=A0ABQ9D4D0_9PASS|nr:Lysophospholipid acyltransferase 1 [Willisornis vidua]
MINFVACQLFALLAAFWFRIYLSPSHASSAVRHAFATLFGIYFAVFCFGWYSIHLFVLVMMNYGIMNMASIPNIHRYFPLILELGSSNKVTVAAKLSDPWSEVLDLVLDFELEKAEVPELYSFVVAMGYLTLCHISRIYIFHYGILTTDFSGPLMIITQKITTLACQLHDGIGRQAEELTAEQNRLAVKSRPSLLEYLSYLLNFMSIIAGPCSNYKDYIAFIEGRHVHMKLLEVNWKQKGYDRLPDPSPTGAVMYKLCITLVSLILFLTLTKNFPMAYIIDNEFLDKTPFLSRLGYLYVVTQAAKPKYYFAWTLADAVNNAAGYGFSGVDERGSFRWDLLSNLNIWNIETATSFKMYLENWNIQTAAWLKRVCYDRAPWYPTALTFILSALWHGIYPGYYFTFLTGILITLAARAIRNNCRQYFLSSVPLKMAYDVVTWAATQLAVCYTVAPFVMLAVEPTIKFYKSVYFHMHILSILVLLLLPIRPQASSLRRAQNQAMVNSVKSKDK